MSDELTWEDVELNPRFLERGPRDRDRYESRPPSVKYLRIVVEGETFIAILDPRLEGEGIKEAALDDGTYTAFVATDAYDGIDKAFKVIAEREAAKKRKSTRVRGKKRADEASLSRQTRAD
jgi:hypothetical protein